MTYNIKLQLRAFPVKIQDTRTGERSEDTIVIDKASLTAAQQITGMDSEKLIWRLYNQKGYYVRQIGKATKQEASVDLTALFQPESETILMGEAKA